MLFWHVDIEKLFERKFLMSPTAQQRAVFGALAKFLEHIGYRPCFVLKGYAGTGKTTIISTLVQVLPTLRKRSVLLAPTGRAAKVVSAYSGMAAHTIHKKIYKKKIAGTPDMAFVLADNLHTDTVFVVDEASMISNERQGYQNRSLLEDLVEYVFSGKRCQLLFVGDMAQLPPVGLMQSPALVPSALEAAFGLSVMCCELTDVVRQDKSSGILYNATRIREQIRLDDKPVGVKFPKLRVDGFADVYRMTGERLIEGLHYAYGKYGMENTLVICRSNKHANLYNQHIRHQILYREEELTGGDSIMVVRNNYYWAADDERAQSFIANGDMATVRRVRNVHEQYGFRFADVSLSFMDREEEEPMNCRVLLDTLHTDSPNLPYASQQVLYEQVMADYADITSKKARLEALKKDPYYNALQIKFAMAVTCHKAQGGQWDAVFVDQGFLTEEMLDVEFLRWLYTACTRATKELFLVNFNALFYEQ
ncbi:ATP-dependent DNA helicase [Olivibacter sitiensis]|uniref:ATP-dependent DNA helicase n=1 Tax=Olivibacter sitiensis TaxID=376470 RepID=UPI0012FB7D22|nr:AAA family ATPase [Olivibacter sitiensis]